MRLMKVKQVQEGQQPHAGWIQFKAVHIQNKDSGLRYQFS